MEEALREIREGRGRTYTSEEARKILLGDDEMDED